MDNDNNNIFKVMPGGKAANQSDQFPTDTYAIVCKNGRELLADGFLIFTSQHVTVMRDKGKGAIPVLLVPLIDIEFAEIVDDDEDEPE